MGSNPDNYFSQKFLKRIGLTNWNTQYGRKVSPLERWFQEKLMKHGGFILESVLEAFPNAILQMIAIILYAKPNIIAIISILLSMTSISTKAYIYMCVCVKYMHV